jgi:hypothetical protein
MFFHVCPFFHDVEILSLNWTIKIHDPIQVIIQTKW